MITAAVRSALRLRNYRRIFVDDIFLFLACAFLTVATIIVYKISATQDLSWLLMQPDGLQKTLVWYHQMIFAYLLLTWASIFAIKLSFLCIFRTLVDRLANMVLYWRIVVGVTVISFGFCVVEVFIECPHLKASDSKFTSSAV